MRAGTRLVHAVALIGAAVAFAAEPGACAAQPWRISKLPVAASAPFSYAEPGIAIARNGLAIVAAASANTGAPPTFWISRDTGATWAPGRDFDITGASTGDVDAAIGSDGYLYALNLGYNPNPPAQPTNPTVLVSRSRDGRTWSGPASFPPPHGSDQPDRPWLIVDPSDPANVDMVNSEGGGNVVIWRSGDHGASFTGPYQVTAGANSEAALALSSRPLFDPIARGRMFVLYETATAGGAATLAGAGTPLYEFPMTQLWLATSHDGGRTWSNRPALDTSALPAPLRDATLGHLLVASAIDRAGNLYAAFSARASTRTETGIHLIHSTDHGETWSAPVAIGAPTKSNVMPALAVSDRGTAYVSWYGSTDPDFRSGVARWVEMFAATANPLAARPSFAVEQVGDATPVHVGGIDTAGAVGSDLGANWGLRDFQGIAADACGGPHLVWASDYGAPATMTAHLQEPGPACARPSTQRHRRGHHRRGGRR